MDLEEALVREMLYDAKAGYDPNQVRDPHTGEWIDDGVPGLPSMDVSPEALEQFGDVIEALSRHRWPLADVPLSVKIVRTRTRRGRQTQAPPMGELIFKGKAPSEIRLRARDDMPGEMRPASRSANTFAHEAGHYLDWQLLGKPRGVVRDNQVLSSAVAERPTPAMSRFLEVAGRTPTMQKWLEGTDDYHSYMASDGEVWARAYAQWALGTVPKGYVQGGYGWPKGEFALIQEALEDVLREADLL